MSSEGIVVDVNPGLIEDNFKVNWFGSVVLEDVRLTAVSIMHKIVVGIFI
jgi:hypothetical protein